MRGFLYLVMFIFLSGTASAGILGRPQWKDICPEGLENAQYNEIQWFWPESTKATQDIYNYWAKRRVEFENAVVECDFMFSPFKENCYENLKSQQLLDNELYNNRIQHKIIRKQAWKDDRKIINPIMIDLLAK